MSLPPLPKPKSPLGYLRILSPTAGIRVSPLCLGAMNFGEKWARSMGECSKETAFGMLDYFFENGGNFVDTSNNYQGEESEMWLGEWMQTRGNRDQMVIATKYTTCYPASGKEKIMANFQGQHAKSLHLSVEASLQKLQTSYIDILFVHWWDFTTSVEEVMQSLNRMVQVGKVLYLGVSDTPAWIVSKANQYARDHGMRQFSVYQGRWNAAARDFERDILHMCREEGMAMMPWAALGGGSFKTDAQRQSQEGRKWGAATEQQIQVSRALEDIANRKGTALTSVALAYVMHKAPYVFPIVGGRKLEHLKGNIEALTLQLSQEDMDEIEDAAPFDLGFPMCLLFDFSGKKKYNTNMTGADIPMLQNAVNLDAVQHLQPIRPHQVEAHE